jgi:hypothetical protein
MVIARDLFLYDPSLSDDQDLSWLELGVQELSHRVAPGATFPCPIRSL